MKGACPERHELAAAGCGAARAADLVIFNGLGIEFGDARQDGLHASRLAGVYAVKLAAARVVRL